MNQVGDPIQIDPAQGRSYNPSRRIETQRIWIAFIIMKPVPLWHNTIPSKRSVDPEPVEGHLFTNPSLLLNLRPPFTQPIRPYSHPFAGSAFAQGPPVKGGLEIEKMPAAGLDGVDKPMIASQVSHF